MGSGQTLVCNSLKDLGLRFVRTYKGFATAGNEERVQVSGVPKSCVMALGI